MHFALQQNNVKSQLDLVGLAYEDLKNIGDAEAHMRSWMRRCIAAANKHFVASVAAGSSEPQQQRMQPQSVSFKQWYPVRA